MKKLSSNSELYEYLLSLSKLLKEQGHTELNTIVTRAINSAVDFSTVFLGESRIALQKVLEQEKGALSAQVRSDIESILKQLDNVFERRKEKNQNV